MKSETHRLFSFISFQYGCQWTRMDWSQSLPYQPITPSPNQRSTKNSFVQKSQFSNIVCFFLQGFSLEEAERSDLPWFLVQMMLSWNVLFQIKSHAMGGENDDNDHDRDDEESDDGDDVMVLKVKCIHSHGSSSSAGFTFSEVHLTYNTARKHHRIRASNLHSISSYPTPRKRDSYSSPRLLFTCNTSKYIKIHYITS